jgi:leucyl-tRNA synthetase
VLKQVSYDYERMQYNTVVSGAMKLLNALEDFDPGTGVPGDAAVLREGVSVLLRVLYPACPHITQVLWQELGFAQTGADLLDARMPAVDESALVCDEIELVLQVNGKTRGAVRVAAAADQAAIEAAAAGAPEVAKFGQGKAVRKVIVVPGRLVNVVCA